MNHLIITTQTLKNSKIFLKLFYSAISLIVKPTHLIVKQNDPGLDVK